jgi:type I restriction enzyme R subunit
MTQGRGWNEENLSENPAVAHLERLGWRYVAADVLDAERESLKQVVVVPRLVAALRRLNPWLSDDNVQKAVRAVTSTPATSLIEANEKLYTTLTYGIALEQDLGDGKRNHPVRFIDFDDASQNDFVVTRQFRVHGTKRNIRTDVMLLVNGIPMAPHRVQEPHARREWKAEALDQFSRYQEMEERYHELGAPKLFETMQVLVATCAQAAVYGTVLTPSPLLRGVEDAVPEDARRLTRELGRKPNAQEILVRGHAPPRDLPRPRAELRRLRARREDGPHRPQAVPVPAVRRGEQSAPASAHGQGAEPSAAASSGTRRARARA